MGNLGPELFAIYKKVFDFFFKLQKMTGANKKVINFRKFCEAVNN